ncbi:MAG: isoprenylcysteine carboxylmethyltransferase family protein [Gemmatimonadota bacterium]
MILALRTAVYEVVLGGLLLIGLLMLALDAAPPVGLLPEILQGLGLLLFGTGATLWAWATWELVARGEGTPLPLDPPRHLVTVGPYGWLRNPMHAGLIAVLIGEALLFRSPVFLGMALVLGGALLAYVVWLEEPSLAGRFGSAWEGYRQTVSRWLPRRGKRDRPRG